MGLFSFLLGRCSKQPAEQSPHANGNGGQSPPAARFSELSPSDKARLDKQRAVIAEEAKRRYGTSSLAKTKADLAVIQRLLDDKAFTKDQMYELQCMGVVFGDALASEMPLRWVMVTDEFGTDPTLRFKDTTIQLNALTMIAKRVEDGVEALDVTNLFAGSQKVVVDMEADFEREKAQKK
ncbi:MAG TPA: DUF3806 domain-containing protein [Verrucomicrobiae bacterium]|nr:DUF3806 domain-containing protein [Verrucomicrobiae bacterium]